MQLSENENFNNNEEGQNYFTAINEETSPFIPDSSVNLRCYSLEQIYNSIFPKNLLQEAKEASKEERDQKQINDCSFIYGEITFRALSYIIEYLKSEFGNSFTTGTFYDMGSGSGKGVITASLMCPFKQCIGIEFLESLHSIALKTQSKYSNTIDNIMLQNPSLFEGFAQKVPIFFKNSDFLEVPWTDASLILFNSTCYSIDLMVNIGKKATKECQSGTILISFTKRIPFLTTDWELRDGFRRIMSWGVATIYIHKKK